ncbi:MAG: DUF3365 domain-containing protein, partial [Nitrospinota bacterium]
MIEGVGNRQKKLSGLFRCDFRHKIYPVSESGNFKRNMKIRYKLGILLAVLLVALNGVIAFSIYKRMRQEFINEVREKAKLIVIEFETTRNHLASALNISKIEINEQTKLFIPAVSGHAIGKIFAEKTGYIIKQTSMRFRNETNKPDPFEEKVLRKMEQDPDLLEYWADDVWEGKRVERYLYALHVKEDCLFCHGSKGRGDGAASIFIGPYSHPRPNDFTRGVFKFRSTESGQLPTLSDLM